MVLGLEIFGKIKHTIEQSAPDAEVILYGSYARGDFRKESDIDLLILVDSDLISQELEEKITHPLYLLEFNSGIIISPVVYTKKAWACHKVTPFYENVNKEGVRL